MAEALGNEKAVGRGTQGVRDDKCPVSPGFVMRETKLLLALLSYGKVGYQRHGEIIRGSATARTICIMRNCHLLLFLPPPAQHQEHSTTPALYFQVDLEFDACFLVFHRGIAA
ncbi:hypothetical protein [Candidatus Nitrotoga sp. AM1P]|uniref:hypothetical protein n=1 Tax=Candidatus Nitrotoga sp. AM1P TaxID=2559597 RepID=UPI0015635C1B|nr:hypothetical protein [Candidatus Nitrotoga sp. AM1P]